MSSRINIRIRSNRNTDMCVHLACDAVDQAHFGAGFNIEEENPGLERVSYLLNCLADSRKNHFLR